MMFKISLKKFWKKEKTITASLLVAEEKERLEAQETALIALKEEKKLLEEKKANILALQQEMKTFALENIPLPNIEIVQRLMNFNFDLHRASGKTENIIPVFAMITSRGQAVLRKAVELDDEHVLVEVSEEEVVRYFTHVKPVLLAVDADLFGGITTRGGWRYAKVHYFIGHEPISRDLYTGSIADSQKKINKLIELGILIYEDSEEAITTFGEGGKAKPSPTGYYIAPEFVENDEYGKPFEIYDVSDIDAITAEVKRAEDDKLVQIAIRAAYEEYEEPDTKSLMWVVLGAFVFGVVIIGAAFFTINEVVKNTAFIINPLRNLLSKLWVF